MYTPNTTDALVKIHVSFGASIIAWLPNFDYAFRILASCIAIIAGAPVAYKVIVSAFAHLRRWLKRSK